MGGSFLKGAVVGLVCAVVGGATVALAGSGINGVFNLGVSNSVNAQTRLSGSTSGAQLRVDNTGTATNASGIAVTSASTVAPALVASNAAGGPAGGFFANAGVPPFTVSSQTKVTYLNADKLDGLDSSALQKRVSGTCAAGTAVRVVNSDGSVACQAVGAGGVFVGHFGTNTGNAGLANGTTCTLGEIRLTASPVLTAGGAPAFGQLLSISQNQALFSLLGTTYGGDGQTTFQLPDLRPITPNNMTYSICVAGVYPSGT
jgi:Phage Tail Collar Domain